MRFLERVTVQCMLLPTKSRCYQMSDVKTSDVNKDLNLKAKARTKDLTLKAEAWTKDSSLKAKDRTKD